MNPNRTLIRIGKGQEYTLEEHIPENLEELQNQKHHMKEPKN